jgi:hypothetical protein
MQVCFLTPSPPQHIPFGKMKGIEKKPWRRREASLIISAVPILTKIENL